MKPQISSPAANFPCPAAIPAIPSRAILHPTITFKKFGISLGFTPVVLSEGRISLKVSTEVSEDSKDNSITLSQAVTPAVNPDHPRHQDPSR